jgi:O-antigen ligase
MLMQRLYIGVLNFFEKHLISKVNSKAKDIVLFVSLFLAFSTMMFFNIQEGVLFETTKIGYAELFLINTFLLCVVILFSMNGPLEKKKWNKLVYLPFFISGILITLPVPGATDRLSTNCFGVLIWLIFPALYLVWSNRGDYEKLFEITAKATLLCMALFLLVNFIFNPVIPDWTGYQGVTGNANSIGIACVAMFVASMALIKPEGNMKYIYPLLAGTALCFAWLAASRASMLAMLLVTLAWVIGFRNKGKKALSVVLSLVLITASFAVLNTITHVISSSELQKQAEELAEETATEETGEAVETDETAGTDEAATEEATEVETADPIEDDFALQKITQSTDVNSASSGRIEIWKFYLSELSLMGHAEKPVVDAHGGEASAHNTYLEIGYRSGIIAGLLYAFVAIYSAIYSFKYIFDRKRKDNRWIFVPLAVMAFGVMSNLERAIYPVEKIHIFMYFVALAPIIMKAGQKKGDSKQD